MTSGTIDFLKKLENQFTDLSFRLMHNNEHAISYYEHENKKIFQTGRTYEILTQSGEMQDTGFVVMNNIPVSEDSQPIFEYQFKNRKTEIETMPGFQAFRFLKPTRGHIYIVLTQWAAPEDFEHWRSTPQFAEAHKNLIAKRPVHFSERPFLTTYNMYDEENH